MASPLDAVCEMIPGLMVRLGMRDVYTSMNDWTVFRRSCADQTSRLTTTDHTRPSMMWLHFIMLVTNIIG